jgi:hypothetical protein
MVGISEGMSVVSVGITVSNMISVLTVSISSSLRLGIRGSKATGNKLARPPLFWIF